MVTSDRRGKMHYANSLRVIGQSLELAKLRVFELATDGPDYSLQSDQMNSATEYILRHALAPLDASQAGAAVTRSVRFKPSDISRLDHQAQRQRRSTSLDQQAYGTLPQLLRVVGDHIDRTQAHAFRISWTYDAVSVEFQLSDGESESTTFPAEKLSQLGARARFQRLSRSRLNSKRPFPERS